MRKVQILVLCLFCIVGCASTQSSLRPIAAFHKQAIRHSRSYDPSRAIDWKGLKVSDGVLPNCPRFPNDDESGVIVTDPDPTEKQSVQIIVTPRVSGSNLDPAEPSAEFLREQAEEMENALRNHRYTGVFLLPKPQAQEVVLTAGDKQTN